MRKLICLTMLIASASGFAEARSVRFQTWVNQLSKLNPAKDEDIMTASTIVSDVDGEVENFSKRKKWSTDEFTDLVTLAAFASPFMSFPETAQILVSIKKNSPELNKAFEAGLNGVDLCRRRQFLFVAKSANGDQEGPAAVARSMGQPSDFDYAKCIAKAAAPAPAAPKHSLKK